MGQMKRSMRHGNVNCHPLEKNFGWLCISGKDKFIFYSFLLIFLTINGLKVLNIYR